MVGKVRADLPGAAVVVQKQKVKDGGLDARGVQRRLAAALARRVLAVRQANVLARARRQAQQVAQQLAVAALIANAGLY